MKATSTSSGGAPSGCAARSTPVDERYAGACGAPGPAVARGPSSPSRRRRSRRGAMTAGSAAVMEIASRTNAARVAAPRCVDAARPVGTRTRGEQRSARPAAVSAPPRCSVTISGGSSRSTVYLAEPRLDRQQRQRRRSRGCAATRVAGGGRRSATAAVATMSRPTMAAAVRCVYSMIAVRSAGGYELPVAQRPVRAAEAGAGGAHDRADGYQHQRHADGRHGQCLVTRHSLLPCAGECPSYRSASPRAVPVRLYVAGGASATSRARPPARRGAP